MALNSTNSTLSCNFTSIAEFFSAVNTANSSISLTIAECSSALDICALAWGSGNPDLSGIGVMRSYWLQLAVLWLFGPAAILCIMLPIGTEERRVETFKRFREILLSLYDIIAIFSIAVAVAAVIRHTQDATIFELSFLQSLLVMTFLSFLSITLVVNGVVNASPLFLSYVARGWHRKNRFDGNRLTFSPQGAQSILERLKLPNMVVHLSPFVYTVVVYGMFIVFTRSFSLSPDVIQANRELFSSCPRYAPLKVSLDVDPLEDYSLSFYQALSNSIWTYIGIIFGFLAALVVIPVVLWIFPWLFPICSTGLCAGATFYLSEMQKKRNRMQQFAGTQFADNIWGFGQVLALFVLLPLISPILQAIVGRWLWDKFLASRDRVPSWARRITGLENGNENKNAENA